MVSASDVGQVNVNPSNVSVTNVTGSSVEVRWPGATRDLLDGSVSEGSLEIEGYGVRWLLSPVS